jgi:hypothetical protein
MAMTSREFALMNRRAHNEDRSYSASDLKAEAQRIAQGFAKHHGYKLSQLNVAWELAVPAEGKITLEVYIAEAPRGPQLHTKSIDL